MSERLVCQFAATPMNRPYFNQGGSFAASTNRLGRSSGRKHARLIFCIPKLSLVNVAFDNVCLNCKTRSCTGPEPTQTPHGPEVGMFALFTRWNTCSDRQDNLAVLPLTLGCYFPKCSLRPKPLCPPNRDCRGSTSPKKTQVLWRGCL